MLAKPAVIVFSVSCLLSSLSTASFAAPGVPPWTSGGIDHYFFVQAPAELVLDGPFRPGARDQIERLNARYGVVAVTPLHVVPPRGWRDPALVSQLGLDRIWIFELQASRPDLATVVARYAAIPGVERSWKDGRVDHCKTPNDELFPSQWNLQQDKLDCEVAWDAVTTETVIVSVIDTGAQLTHLDLKDNLWVNPGEIANNGKDDDHNGYIDDVNGWDFWYGDDEPFDENGHGTHVSGIIGARGDNDLDVTGICWKAMVQPVQVLKKDASGTYASIAQGVVYAADNGASVVNLSCGGPDYDPGLEAAIAYGAGLDVVQVAAAGNTASDELFYPAAYDGVISVMASDPNDKRPAWSTYGDWCDLIAPGDGVYSLWTKDKTNILSGTSQASPHVAGVAALIRSMNAQLDRVDVEAVILTSCDDLGAPGKDSTFQWGRLNARKAIARSRILTLERLTMQQGESLAITVEETAHPGDLYLVNPTLAERLPGYVLDQFFPGDLQVVPINFDWLSTYAFNQPDIGIFDDFFGNLDGSGTGNALFNLPRGSGFVGLTIHFSGFTADPLDLSKARQVMNSVGVDVQ